MHFKCALLWPKSTHVEENDVRRFVKIGKTIIVSYTIKYLVNLVWLGLDYWLSWIKIKRFFDLKIYFNNWITKNKTKLCNCYLWFVHPHITWTELISRHVSFHFDIVFTLWIFLFFFFKEPMINLTENESRSRFKWRSETYEKTPQKHDDKYK